MLKAKEFTLELEKIDAGENPLPLEGENKGIAELAAFISRIGLINPLVVAPDGERYHLIAGHRRRGAAAANEQSDPNPQRHGQEPAREGRGELVRPPEQRMSPIRPPS